MSERRKGGKVTTPSYNSFIILKTKAIGIESNGGTKEGFVSHI
jgi:hypothetical protein